MIHLNRLFFLLLSFTFLGCSYDQKSDLETHGQRRFIPNDGSRYELVGFSCSEEDSFQDLSESVYLNFGSSYLSLNGEKMIFDWSIRGDTPDKIPCGIPPFSCEFRLTGEIDWASLKGSESDFSVKLKEDSSLKLDESSLACRLLATGQPNHFYYRYVKEDILSTKLDGKVPVVKVDIAHNINMVLDKENEQIKLQLEYDFYNYRSSFCRQKGVEGKDYPNPIYLFKKMK